MSPIRRWRAACDTRGMIQLAAAAIVFWYVALPLGRLFFHLALGIFAGFAIGFAEAQNAKGHRSDKTQNT